MKLHNSAVTKNREEFNMSCKIIKKIGIFLSVGLISVSTIACSGKKIMDSEQTVTNTIDTEKKCFPIF